MATFATRVVDFISNYTALPIEEKRKPKNVTEVDEMKKIVESALENYFHMALGWGIRLGEASEDPEWIKRLVLMAKDYSTKMDQETRDDFEESFQSYF